MTSAELKAFRIEMQMTQGALAQCLGVSRTTLVGYERGTSPVPKLVELGIAALHADVELYHPSSALLQQAKQRRRMTASDPVPFKALQLRQDSPQS